MHLTYHLLVRKYMIAKLDGLPSMGNVTSSFLRRKPGRRHRMFAKVKWVNWFPFILPKKTTL